jgi:hypothetical protein
MTLHCVDPECADVAPFLVRCKTILSRLPHETIGIGVRQRLQQQRVYALKIGKAVLDSAA